MTQPEQDTQESRLYTEAEINHGLLDMPDMGNSAILIMGSQAVAEAVTSQPVINTVILGVAATGLFFSGLTSEAKAMEHVASQTSLDDSSRTGRVSLVDRMRGIGYALIATGVANETIGVIHSDFRRIIVGIGIAGAGIASAMIGAHLRPEPPVVE